MAGAGEEKMEWRITALDHEQQPALIELQR
jgi:hypothetical protein